MDPAQSRRYARQIALPELGPEGQDRIAAALVIVVGADLCAETAARYLAAAGVGRIGLICAIEHAQTLVPFLRASNPEIQVLQHEWPRDGAGWLAALEGATLCVRSGFDDDSMLRAAVRYGLPVIAARGRNDRAEVIALRKQGPCPHTPVDIPEQRGTPSEPGAGAVLAGTLAATEALLALAGAGGDARARHISVPLDGGEVRAQEIPWAPECFRCGGSSAEMETSWAQNGDAPGATPGVAASGDTAPQTRPRTITSRGTGKN